MKFGFIPFLMILSAGTALASQSDPQSEMALAQLMDAPGSPGTHEVEQFVLTPWKNGPRGLWMGVALVLHKEETTLAVGVFTRDERGYRLQARHLGGEPLAGEPIWNASVEFDPVTFRVSPRETAIAVRVTNLYSSTARSSSTTSLQLYRFKGRGEELTPIFSGLTFEDYLDKEDGSETRFERIVFFSKHRTETFYDLLLKDKATGAVRKYVWDGNVYR